jgi:hypothetical protein
VRIRGRLLLLCAIAGALPLCAAGKDKNDDQHKQDNHDNDIVYLNAIEEHKTCVLAIETTQKKDETETGRKPKENRQPEAREKPGEYPPKCLDTDAGYLVRGKRAQFRVVNRKFFSDYSINIDGVTQLKQIAIQELEEAANLQTPIQSAVSAVTKGAAPKGLTTTGQLPLRIAQDLLAELVDAGKASNPASELESDALIVEREKRKVDAEVAALDETWKVISGEGAPSRDCQASLGAPNLSSALSCIHNLHGKETTYPWDGRGPFRDEDKFRDLTVEIGDAITLVRALGRSLQQDSAAFSNQLSALDGDLAQFKADLNALHGNVVAAYDAVTAYGDLSKGAKNVLTPLRRAQIKLKLMQDLNGAAAGGKPAFDDAELNRLVEMYLANPSTLGKDVTDAQNRALQNKIQSIATRQTAHPLPGGGDVVKYYIDSPVQVMADQTKVADEALKDHQSNLGERMPSLIYEINAAQSLMLARANEIYDHSAVPEPLDKVIDLSKTAGNLHVYFTVRRVDVFPRYNVPVITVQGSAPPVVPVTPPGTGSTPASTGGAGQEMSAGTVVAHGSFDVHDFYRATVVAAFTFSTIKDQTVRSKSITSGQANDGTACTPTSPCSQPFLDKGSPIPSVVVGVNYYLSKQGHDTFPGAVRSVGQKVGIFGGLAATRLNSYFLGLGFEPSEAIQLTGGVNFVSQDSISGAFSPDQVYAGTPSFGGRSTWSKGAYFGAGFNLSIFRKIFGSVTGLGTKASGAGN